MNNNGRRVIVFILIALSVDGPTCSALKGVELFLKTNLASLAHEYKNQDSHLNLAPNSVYCHFKHLRNDL